MTVGIVVGRAARATAESCDARYTDAGPGRLHLNACVCGRIESIAGRMSGDRGMREGNER
jgi:hypothetical protein